MSLLPYSPIVKIPTRDGEMIAPRHDRYVTLSLELYGEYSRDERTALERFLAPGDVVVVAGANIGAIAIPLARAVGPTGHVFAFEPQNLLHRCLVANAMIAEQLHVSTMNVAVGARNGTACLPAIDYNVPGNYGGVSLATEQTDVQVPLRTIDDTLVKVPRCKLLHIDVEGAELETLAGAAHFIERTRPVLCIEIDRPHVRNALPAWLEANRYHAIEHQPPLYSPANWNGNPVNVFEDDARTPVVSMNCLAVPREKMADLGVHLSAIRGTVFGAAQPVDAEPGSE